VSETHETPAPMSKRRDFRNFLASVRYAVEGFWAAFRSEPSFREDLLFVVLLLPFAILLPVNAVSTALMIFSLVLIMVVELLNSAIEGVIDYLRPEIHPLAKRVKDMASAAVFMTYVASIIVWVTLLWPSNAVWTRLGHVGPAEGAPGPGVALSAPAEKAPSPAPASPDSEETLPSPE
jgi:diacylglycerol kinase (ATP)